MDSETRSGVSVKSRQHNNVLCSHLRQRVQHAKWKASLFQMSQNRRKCWQFFAFVGWHLIRIVTTTRHPLVSCQERRELKAEEGRLLSRSIFYFDSTSWLGKLLNKIPIKGLISPVCVRLSRVLLESGTRSEDLCKTAAQARLREPGARGTF